MKAIIFNGERHQKEPEQQHGEGEWSEASSRSTKCKKQVQGFQEDVENKMERMNGQSAIPLSVRHKTLETGLQAEAKRGKL